MWVICTRKSKRISSWQRVESSWVAGWDTANKINVNIYSWHRENYLLKHLGFPINLCTGWISNWKYPEPKLFITREINAFLLFTNRDRPKAKQYKQVKAIIVAQLHLAGKQLIEMQAADPSSANLVFTYAHIYL